MMIIVLQQIQNLYSWHFYYLEVLSHGVDGQKVDWGRSVDRGMYHDRSLKAPHSKASFWAQMQLPGQGYASCPLGIYAGIPVV